MSENRKYYFLKLKEDFFEQDMRGFRHTGDIAPKNLRHKGILPWKGL